MSGPGSDTAMAAGDTGSNDTPGKPHAPKDRACPFCKELFTSSSLGRHLDLYLKEKNPKPPDGVHDVDAIRHLRAGITRRQPKRSLAAPQRDGSTPTRALASATPQAPRSQTGDDGSSVAKTPVNGKAPYTAYTFNRPTWQATGVMMDIPNDPQQRPEPAPRRGAKGDAAMKRKLLEEHTRRRATELALQELVDSVNATT